MTTKAEILERFRLFCGGTGGIDSWLTEETPNEVFEALNNLESAPLTRSQLNQLLILSHEAPVGEAFFEYYWLTEPKHVYEVTKIPCYNTSWIAGTHIGSLDQLYWGLYRFYVDALLFFGNIRAAYQTLRWKTKQELSAFFEQHRFDPQAMKSRGAPIQLRGIAKDNRYLISEMACKSYDFQAGSSSELEQALLDGYREHLKRGGGLVTVKQLLDGSSSAQKGSNEQMLLFSADDILGEQIRTEQELREKYQRVAEAFSTARVAALKNTEYYLSMVGDLDVYVATSMRTRQDFRAMADFCESVFADPRLRALHLRYFDPTLSAANNHEDKGLIECLMVKCAKVLVYHAGQRESFGKDAEAAMALSLGKPVIFQCDEEQRQLFFREVHPLSRLIQFSSGVAVGALVTQSPQQVSEILSRIFRNDMEYALQQKRPGYLCLVEKLTECVVRLQTNDSLLRETFWNHYQIQR